MEGVVRRVVVAMVLNVAAVGAQAAGPYYRIEKLQDASGLFDFSLAAINNDGTAVGTRYSMGEGRSEGFTYRHGVMRFLGTLGGPNSSAWSINQRGDVLGSADISGFTAAANTRACRRTGFSAWTSTSRVGYWAEAVRRPPFRASRRTA